MYRFNKCVDSVVVFQSSVVITLCLTETRLRPDSTTCRSCRISLANSLYLLPFTFLGPSDFGLLCRVCSWLICRNWQFSGVGRLVRIACCLLLDVVAGVVFGCRCYIVDSVGGNVQWSHHCRGSRRTLRCGPS